MMLEPVIYDNLDEFINIYTYRIIVITNDYMKPDKAFKKDVFERIADTNYLRMIFISVERIHGKHIGYAFVYHEREK